MSEINDKVLIFESNYSRFDQKTNVFIPPLDTTVQLADPDEDSFLTDIVHLLLELSVNGQVVDKDDLFSNESSPGTWEAASESLVL
jgi:hypothetical protein